MAKKRNKEKKSEVVVVKPGLKDYIVAIFQLVRDWFKTHKIISYFILSLMIIGGIVIAYSFAVDRSELTNDEIVISVSRQLSISGDTNPAILDVIDEQKVSQPFLQDAQNGDKVLLYYKAGKSVLFRPSNEQIVREGTFTPPDAKVFIRNGGASSDVIATTRQTVEKTESVDLVSSDRSPIQDYTGITVISVTDRYDVKTQEIAEALNAEVVRLPAGESVPDADILVIVGK